jgi:GNAT superfamily N-acetyltransferase
VQVHPAQQGHGVGQQLVTAALLELRPIASLVLLATTKPLYYQRHWGFKALDRFRAASMYERDGEIEHLMSLQIGE